MATVVAEKLPHWDLSNVYPGLDSDEFAQAIDTFKAQLDDLDAYLATHDITRTPQQPPDLSNSVQLAEIIAGVVERLNSAYVLYGTLGAYIASFVSTDSYDNEAKKRLSELEVIGVRTSQQGIKFAGWMGLVAGALPQVLQQPGILHEHAFYLQEVAEQSKYMMSETEEALAAELNLSGGNAWSKLHGIVTSQLTVTFDGKKLPITALQNLRSDPSSDVRRRAYEAELAAWESVREPLAAAMNGIKGAVGTLDRRRGRVDALHATLDQTRIDRETLDAMLGAMRDSFPMFRKYFKAKAARLGHTALPWWDISAPVGKSERRFSWGETRAFIIEQFGHFSDNMARFAQRAFDHNWIDAEPRDGKRGGAFCMGVPSVKESRVLCNFDGSLDQVFTVAHELGHGFHSECMRDRTPLQRVTPMTLNETASIFCETIVTDAVLSSVSDPGEELAILETALIGSSQVIVDISSRFMFEQEVFERRAKSELSADDLCEIMLRAQDATYGDGLDPQYRNKYMWTWKPHYYSTGRSFYNYPYAFGLLFGTGLYALYLERGKSFIPEYEALLSSTGMHNAADLAARFGIDIRAKDFWKDSLDIIGKRVDRYAEL